MKIYNPSPEERAFLYQEAQALEPLIKDLSMVTVVVEEFPQVKARLFRVSFVFGPEAGGMRIQATDQNIFSATIAAKDEAERQLNALVNALPRAQAIPTVGSPMSSPHLH
jgi:hypothetical protein